MLGVQIVLAALVQQFEELCVFFATIDTKIIKDPYQNKSGNFMRKPMGQTGETHGGNSDRCKINAVNVINVRRNQRFSIATFVCSCMPTRWAGVGFTKVVDVLKKIPKSQAAIFWFKIFQQVT